MTTNIHTRDDDFLDVVRRANKPDRERAKSRREIAAQMLAALLANPARYAYIARMVEEGMSQEEATLKNVRKAICMADALLAELKQ